jgi:plastocyanin
MKTILFVLGTIVAVPNFSSVPRSRNLPSGVYLYALNVNGSTTDHTFEERRTTMKGIAAWLSGVFIGAVLLGVLGCKSDSGNPYGSNPPSNIPPNTVVMSSSLFNPATITVQRTTTITWRNDDGAVHTSTSDSTGWDTGDIPPGANRTTTFSTPGTFRYHCTYHRSMGMVGTIIVQ